MQNDLPLFHFILYFVVLQNRLSQSYHKLLKLREFHSRVSVASWYSSFNQVEYQSFIGIPTIFCDMIKAVICETCKTVFWETRKTVFAKREKLYFAKLYFETEEKSVVVCKVSKTIFFVTEEKL